MKTIKILFLALALIFLMIFLVDTVSAVVVYGEWNSNNAQSAEIEDGDSVDFSAYFGTLSPPMTISIKLYSGNNLVHVFEDAVINKNSFTKTYTVNKGIYSGAGDFQVKIKGSDKFGDVNYVLYLTVNYVPNPSLSQTVELADYVNAEYNAVFSDLDNAILEIYYGTDLIATRNINAPSYNEIFNFYNIHQKTKGDYRFVLEAVGYDLSITDEINIPDYIPEVDLGSILADFNEEDSIEINLPAPADKNPEDEPVNYLSAVSPDGKTSADINGNILTLEGNRDLTGDYSVELEFGDSEGAKANATLDSYIYALPDISGILEDNEEHIARQGVIRVYYQDPTNSSNYISLEIDKIYEGTIIDAGLGKIQTTSDGSFSFQINKRASELNKIILQARPGTPENYTGYVRTITLSGDDNSNVLVRAVPYAPYEDNPTLFRQFIYELGGSPPNTRFDFDGSILGGFSGFENYTGLIGIEILSVNPFGAEYGTFTQEQQNNIKNKILDLNDISGIIGDYIINESQIHILTENQSGHYDLYNASVEPKQRVIPYKGWIIVVPYKNMAPAGLADTFKAGTLVYKGAIYLTPGTNDPVISHEFGHIFIGGGHPTIMPSNQTVMTTSPNIPTTGPADKKAGKLIYEETFMAILDPLEYPSLDYVYNILGLEFYAENHETGFGEHFEDENLIGKQEDSSNNVPVIQKKAKEKIASKNVNKTNRGTMSLQSDKNNKKITDKSNIISISKNNSVINVNKKSITESLSNIFKKVISFISQKIKSVF